MWALKCLVLCVFVIEVPSVSFGDSTARHLKRTRRQNDDSWNWGSGDTNAAVAPSTEGPNPCFNTDPPPAPNFTAPGRRLSQVKCYEYMWTIRVLTDEAQKNEDCAQMLLNIIGGRDAILHEFPHMAALGWKAAVGGGWLFKCGGSLISNKFVLTAGHCSKASDRDSSLAELVPKIVRLGQNNIDAVTTGLDVNILRIINHPNYKPPRKYFDIALVELEKTISFTEYIQPACLHVGLDNIVGQRAQLTGWGVTDAAGLRTSPELQTVEVGVLDSRLCDRVYKRTCSRLWCNMTADQLCAGNLAGGQDACQGDSGGPLQIKFALPKNVQRQHNIYRIIGVTSFGIGCALPNVPGIYTRVSSFLDWIEPIVWG